MNNFIIVENIRLQEETIGVHNEIFRFLRYTDYAGHFVRPTLSPYDCMEQ